MQPRFTPIIVDAPQLSPQWFTARIGNLTGSKVKLTMSYRAPTKSHMKLAKEFYVLNSMKFSKDYLEQLEKYPIEYCLKAGIALLPNDARETYKRQIVGERITGMSADADMYTNKAMLWGQQQERFAKRHYVDVTGNKLDDAPLMLHPKLMCGASPDGIVIDIHTGEIGNLESKSLEFWNHLYKIVLPDKMPDEFIPQVQMQMWIDGYDWCDFIGYDPRVKEGIQMFIKRIPRDDFYIYEILVPSIVRFLDECDEDERKFYAIIKKRSEDNIKKALETFNNE